MQRVGFEMKIHPEMVEEYKQRHDDIWPEMSEALVRTGCQTPSRRHPPPLKYGEASKAGGESCICRAEQDRGMSHFGPSHNIRLGRNRFDQESLRCPGNIWHF